jgi:hypothetical protein
MHRVPVRGCCATGTAAMKLHTKPDRVFHGGSWDDNMPVWARATKHYITESADLNGDLGFRYVLVVRKVRLGSCRYTCK